MKLHSFTYADDGVIVGYTFHCPGCYAAGDSTYHAVYTNQPSGYNWTFNGDMERPSFSPSLLMWWDRGFDLTEPGRPKEARRCHLYITDGKIIYLPDSTHGLAGQTIDLPEWDVFKEDPKG